MKLTIQDLGRGFDANDSNNKMGSGLQIMAERIHLIGDDFSVRSTPSRGTLIKVTALKKANTHHGPFPTNEMRF